MQDQETTELPKTQEELDTELESYLARLPTEDQENLRSIAKNFPRVLNKNGRKGVLKVVGGTIDQPLPRKDIDLTFQMDPNDNDPKRDDFMTYLEYAQSRFKIFKEIVEEIAGDHTLFSISLEDVIEPGIDEEFQSTSILKTDGSITIKPKKGTPIEIIRKPENSDRIETRPYIVLKAA